MRIVPITTAYLLLVACGSGAPSPDASNKSAVVNADKAIDPAPSPGKTSVVETSSRWTVQSNSDGATLALAESGGKAVVRLLCPVGARTLVVNIPGFRPIGSEERLSFGSGSQVEALVADTKGDRTRGGVTATGALPADLERLIAGPISARYGAQSSGPHDAPSKDLVREFVAACSAPAAAQEPGTNTAAAACGMQGDQRLDVRPLRAIGTEPFWNAQIDGRCVTYSHPEDQKGIRVWTRYSKDAKGETWTGALGGKPFELRARSQPGCSDGMSDKTYPIAVELRTGGEARKGCAAPS